MPSAEHESLRDAFLEAGLPAQLYYNGKPRLSSSAVVLPQRFVRRLYTAAESMALALDELCIILSQDDSLFVSAFGFDLQQTTLWKLSALQWMGLARADVIADTSSHLWVLELNSDTPSGLDEALVLDSCARKSMPTAQLLNSAVRERWLEMIGSEVPAGSTVALLYPGDLPEDMGLLFLYRQWLEESGYRVILCAPQNLVLDAQDYCCVFGQRVDLIYRHYKTDWWFQQRPVWHTERSEGTPAQAAALNTPLRCIAVSMGAHKLKVTNSFATLVSQSKICLALLHEQISQLSTESQDFVRSHIPFSMRCRTENIEQLRSEREAWVLKSEYGCEGAETIVGAECSQSDWELSLARIIPERWIAQRYIEPERDVAEQQLNYGVYVVQGRAGGLFLRCSQEATDNRAMVRPVVLRHPLQQDADIDQGLISSSGHRTESTVSTDTTHSSHQSQERLIVNPNRDAESTSLQGLAEIAGTAAYTKPIPQFAKLAWLYRVLEPASDWRAWYSPLVLFSDNRLCDIGSHEQSDQSSPVSQPVQNMSLEPDLFSPHVADNASSDSKAGRTVLDELLIGFDDLRSKASSNKSGLVQNDGSIGAEDLSIMGTTCVEAASNCNVADTNMLCILDLPGSSALQLMLRASSTAEWVLQYNNIAPAIQPGSLREVLEYLTGNAAALAAKQPRIEKKTPVCMLLDSRRLDDANPSPEFLHCGWLAQLPDAEFLRAQNCTRVVYCSDKETELDDVHGDLWQWQKEGIDVQCLCGMGIDTLLSKDASAVSAAQLFAYSKELSQRRTRFHL